MTCPTDTELLAFIEGSLSPEARSSAETHLDSCPSCLALVAALARTSESGAGEREGKEGSAVAPSSLATPGPLLADGAPRYVPGAEIARGGMGRILAAEDRLLGRRVALKLLRRNSESLARRFLREQRITAQLQHPAIVPVYDAGALPDGEPFFAMRLVKGESLDRTAAKARSLEERLRLLPAVLGVVDAIAYAHGEGVVHRDLKPQNVLVGPFGEVVVLDWGLARELGKAREPGSESGSLRGEDGTAGVAGTAGVVVTTPAGVAGSGGVVVTAPAAVDGSAREDRQDGHPARPAAGRVGISEPVIADSDEPDATRAGEVLGTLAYMAPEQAGGRAADARSDVYGLGAILYHVLTGAPPHAERSLSLSAGAVSHQPRPLAGRVPDAPADLVAIVERAMARDPEARYPSAQQLAEDLKRWQAGRLVEAHRYSSGDLLRRFLRRYRAPLLVAAAALVVLATLGGFGLRRIFEERSRALAEQARAESARGRAEAQRAAAETLVGFILGDLRGRLERVGRLDALQGVSRAVLAYQDGSPPAEDAATSLRRSEAAGLAGDVAFAMGDLGAAEETFQRSREAAEAAGTAEGAAQARCRAALRLGDVRKRRGQLDEAIAFYEGCAATTRGAAAPAQRELFVQTRMALAEVARMRGDLPGSRRLLEEGRPIAVALVEQAGGPGADVSRLLLTLRSDLWKTLNLSAEVAAERVEAVAALELARARAAARPDDSGARYDLAIAQEQLGAADEHGGDLVAAEQAYRRTLAEVQLLAARDPSNTEWQRAVGVATDRLGSLFMARGDARAALPWLQESDAASVRLVAIEPGNLEWQRDLAVSALALGDALIKLERVDEARAQIQRAAGIHESLIGKGPDAGRAEHDLGVVLGHLGQLELGANRLADGQAAMRRSIEVLERHLRAVDTPQTRMELAAAILILAETERGAAALEHIEKGVAILDPVRGLAAANSDLRDMVTEADEMLTKARAAK